MFKSFIRLLHYLNLDCVFGIWLAYNWVQLWVSPSIKEGFCFTLLIAVWTIYSLDRMIDGVFRSSDQLRDIHLFHQRHSMKFIIGMGGCCTWLLFWISLHPQYLLLTMFLTIFTICSIVLGQFSNELIKIIKNSLVSFIIVFGISLQIWIYKSYNTEVTVGLFIVYLLTAMNLTMTDIIHSEDKNKSFSVAMVYMLMTGVLILAIYMMITGYWIQGFMVVMNGIGHRILIKSRMYGFDKKICAEWLWNFTFMVMILSFAFDG